MAYIATLKKNNTVIYPQTKSTAVYEDDGVTPIDDVVVKKSTAVADANKMIKADGTKALVTASNIDFTTLGGNYSTDEVDTGYTWIDGSHIYKKTILFGALPNAGQKIVDHGISNLAMVVNVYGIASSLSGDRFTLPNLMLNTGYITQMKITNTSIQMDNSVDRSSYNAWVTIYYTKSS